MVRSLWIKSVIGALALAGHARGQATPYVHTAAGQVKERIITVQELSKPGQRCKILKTWHLPDGAKAYQVQALGTGEMMTIVETGSTTSGGASGAPPIKAVSTRIYHWGGSETPPKGAPLAPENATVLGTPLSAKGDAPAPTAPPPLKEEGKAASKKKEGKVAPKKEEAKAAPKGEPSKPAPVRAPGTPAVWRQWPGTMQESVQEAAKAADSPPVQNTPPAPVHGTPPVRETTSAPKVYSAPVTPSAVTAKPAPQLPAGAKHWPPAYAEAPVSRDVLPAPAPSQVQPTLTIPAPAVVAQPAPVQSVEVPPKTVTKVPEPDKKPVVKAPEPDKKPVVKVKEPEKKPVVKAAEPDKKTLAKAPEPDKMPAPAPVIVTTPAAKSDKSETKVATIVTGKATEDKTPPAPTIVTAKPEPAKKEAPAPVLTRLPETKPAPASPYQQTTTKADGAKATALVKVSTEPAQPGDWRQSWGKVDGTKASSEGPRLTQSLRSPPKAAELPHADASRPDPLKNLEPFSKETLAKVEKKGPAAAAVKSDVILLGSNGAGRPAPLEPTKPVEPNKATSVSFTKVEKAPEAMPPHVAPLSDQQPRVDATPAPMPTAHVQSIPSPSTSTQSVVQTAPAPAVHLGAGSVIAAGGSPDFVPPPILPVPQGPPPVAPTGPVLQAPHSNHALGGATMRQPGPAVDSGVPPGMANAFTKPGTGRPLPADFNAPQQVANAFPNPAAATQPHAGGQMMAQGYAPPQPINPVMTVPGQHVATAAPPVYLPPEATVNVPQMLAVLRDSIYPSQRQGAIEQLSRLDWKAHPEVVQGLVAAAKEDPAPMVRADCVRGLVRMKANPLAVGAVLEALKADPDQGVRQEVEQAIPILGGGPAVQPAGGR